MTAAFYLPEYDLNSAWADHDPQKMLTIDGTSVYAEMGVEQQFRLQTSDPLNVNIPIKYILQLYAVRDTMDGALDVKVRVANIGSWTALQSCSVTSVLTMFNLVFDITPGDLVDVSLMPGRFMFIDYMRGLYIFEETSPPLPDPEEHFHSSYDPPPVIRPAKKRVILL